MTMLLTKVFTHCDVNNFNGLMFRILCLVSVIFLSYAFVRHVIMYYVDLLVAQLLVRLSSVCHTR